MSTDTSDTTSEQPDPDVTSIAFYISIDDYKSLARAREHLIDLGLNHRQPPTEMINKELERQNSQNRLVELGVEKYCKCDEPGKSLFIYKMAIRKLGSNKDAEYPFVVLQYVDAEDRSQTTAS